MNDSLQTHTHAYTAGHSMTIMQLITTAGYQNNWVKIPL